MDHVIVAGAVKGNISAEKVEIRSTGRVWGDILAIASTLFAGAAYADAAQGANATPWTIDNAHSRVGFTVPQREPPPSGGGSGSRRPKAW